MTVNVSNCVTGDVLINCYSAWQFLHVLIYLEAKFFFLCFYAAKKNVYIFFFFFFLHNFTRSEK